jgi:hypothetical protein
LGSFAGVVLDRGSFNTGIGSKALSNAGFVSVNNFSSYNTALGFEALNRVNNADSNVALGYRSMANNTTGSNNIAIGTSALDLNTTGSFNTIVGHLADLNANNLNNAIAIGANARIDTSNAMVLGSVSGINGATASVNVGIGTTKPFRKLHVKQGTSGGTFQTNTNFILEGGTINYMELSTPSAALSGIISSTNLTSIRSRILFEADSSITFCSGGSLNRMALDNNGNLGINTTAPASKLDVNGTFTLGANGTVNNALIKNTVNIDVPSIAANSETLVTVAMANVTATAAVSVSPSADLTTGIAIVWVRATAGIIRIKFRNLTAGAIDPAAIDYYISVVQ